MSKKIPEPIYFHDSQPVFVKLGSIFGQDLYIQLTGDTFQREHDYLRLRKVLSDMFKPWKSEDEL